MEMEMAKTLDAAKHKHTAQCSNRGVPIVILISSVLSLPSDLREALHSSTNSRSICTSSSVVGSSALWESTVQPALS